MAGSYDDAAAAREWIRTAGVEYDRIASLCNAQALLCNAAASSPSPPIIASDDGRGGGDKGYDPKTLAVELQRRSLHEALSSYYREIDAARATHSSVTAQLASLSPQLIGDDAISARRTEGCRERTPPVAEAFSKHIELSERVIRTVMRSSPNPGGPCGALHENGMLRPISAADPRRTSWRWRLSERRCRD